VYVWLYVQRKQTALHVAVEVGNSDICSVLLAAGTKLCLRDSVSSRYLLLVFRASLVAMPLALSYIIPLVILLYWIGCKRKGGYPHENES